MKALCYEHKKIKVPENWNELTPKQYLRIVALLHSCISNETVALERTLQILSGKSFFRFLLIPADMRTRMHEHIEWVFDQAGLSEQLLPSFRRRPWSETYYGPAADFDNLRMKEFHAAEMAHYRLKHEQDIDALNELIAVLYRPGKKHYNKKLNPDGDMRVPYNTNETDYYKKQVRCWPLNIKRAILMWYDGCRQQLEEEHKPAFENDGSGTSKDYFDGLYGMIRGIAEKKTYGDFESVGEMYVRLAFKEIVETKLEEAELKRRYPQLYK